MARARKQPTAKRVWEPLQQVVPSQEVLAQPLPDDTRLEVWSNDRYEVIARHHEPSGMTHLSIKRHDRSAVIDWRHLWQIKTETCGPGREGCELYPAATRLVDASNQRHIWVLPEGQQFPFGYDDRLVLTPEQVAAEHPGAKQRPFEPGLSIGSDDT